MKVKIKLNDLKNTLSWIESNTRAEYVEILQDQRNVLVSCIDNHDRMVTIELWEASLNNMPKLTRTENLPNRDRK